LSTAVIASSGSSRTSASRKGGLIIVTSAGAHYSTPNLAVYGGTKAFLLSFNEALATELQGTGVRALTLPWADLVGVRAGRGHEQVARRALRAQ
jgi:short-subunit dehydrogenase